MILSSCLDIIIWTSVSSTLSICVPCPCAPYSQDLFIPTPTLQLPPPYTHMLHTSLWLNCFLMPDLCKPLLTTPRTFLPICYLRAIYHSRPHAAFMKKVDNIPRHKASNKLITIPAFSKDLKSSFLVLATNQKKRLTIVNNFCCKLPSLQTQTISNCQARVGFPVLKPFPSVEYMIENQILPF